MAKEEILLDMEPSSSPPSRPRRKTKKLTPCRLCLGLVVLVVGGFLSVFLWTIGSLALEDVQQSRHPHQAHHHTKNQSMEELGESNLVRSFYGEAKDGGIERFDMIASIYHRVRIGNDTELVASIEVEAGEGSSAVVSREEKKEEEGKESLVWGPWERIFSEPVLEGLSMKSKGVKTVAKVVLPGRIL